MSFSISHLSSCKLHLTNADKSLIYVEGAHAEPFLGVGIAYPGTRPRPRPRSNHAKSAGIKHAAANGVLVLLPLTSVSISCADLLACKAGQVVFPSHCFFFAFMQLADSIYGHHATMDVSE